MDLKHPGKVVAVKMEANDCEWPSLQLEASVYRGMKSTSKNSWITKVIWAGLVEGIMGLPSIYRALIMPLLGPCIQKVWRDANGRFTFCTTMGLADQMVGAPLLIQCWEANLTPALCD